MKKYISCCTWRDLTDRHLYHEGDQFPFDGREVKPERLAELESGVNRAGLKLIKADEAAEPEVQKEAQPESEQEQEPEPEQEQESEPEQEKDPEPEQEPEKPKQKPARKPANKK